jgi:hypothetical protein
MWIHDMVCDVTPQIGGFIHHFKEVVSTYFEGLLGGLIFFGGFLGGHWSL